jgi:hypothetical protein
MPPGWVGIFCTEDFLGELLFDVSPGVFLSFLSKRPDEDAPYLVAGALFDLLRNNLFDQANELIVLAHARWPEESWEILPGSAVLAQVVSSPDDQPELKAAVVNAVGLCFTGGRSTVIMSGPGSNPSETPPFWREIFATDPKEWENEDPEATVSRYRESAGGQYLMAGTIFDVYLNEDFELADELIGRAYDSWDGPWDILFGAYILSEELRKHLGNDATDRAIRLLVMKLFGEGM